MITKEEKKRIVTLAEKGKTYLEIAEAIATTRILKMLMELNSEVTNYLEELEESIGEEE